MTEQVRYAFMRLVYIMFLIGVWFNGFISSF